MSHSLGYVVQLSLRTYCAPMESVADSPHEPDDQQDCFKLSFWTVGDSEVIQIDMRIGKDKS